MKEELKIKDVMVGDWVDVRNDAAPNIPHLERITPSHFLRDEHWYGVELVPEVLEKNGFEEGKGGNFCRVLNIDEYKYVLYNFNDSFIYIRNEFYNMDVQIHYVHQL